MNLVFSLVLLVILIAPITATDFFNIPNTRNIIDSLLPLSDSQQEKEMKKETNTDTKSAQNKTSSLASGQ